MNYEELVKALRNHASKESDCGNCPYFYYNIVQYDTCSSSLCAAAAVAIEDLQSDVNRLKECNDELREAQTYIDHYGDKWLTSAKDVPTSAYNHGYMDGKNEAEAAQPHWVSVFDDLPRHNAVVVVSDGKRSWDVGQYHFLFKSDDRTIWWWKKHTTRKVIWWMYKEDALPQPPQEVQDGQK